MDSTKIRLSMGRGMLPEQVEALEHYQSHPNHDPTVGIEVQPDGSRKVWWRCMGEHDSHSEDPHHLCAFGGQYP